MKTIAKQNPIPLKLTLEFETLEELQALHNSNTNLLLEFTSDFF